MNTQIAAIHSPEAYLAFERASETKHEFIFQTIIPMAGASLLHNRIVSNIFLLIGYFVRGAKFAILPSDMRVYNPVNESYFYPDIVVTDGKPRTIDKDLLTNPLLVVEVASPSTAVFDKTDKFIAYRSIETLREYILVSTDAPEIEVFWKNEKGEWSVETVYGIEKLLKLHSIDFTLSLQEVFKEFSE